MKKTVIYAAALLSFAGAAHADEVTDLKAEAKALQQQNEALNRRLAAIEKRQKALDESVAASRQRALNANAADLGAYPTKAVPYAPTDDSLTWHGVTLYGVVDAGVTWQAHSAPFNGSYPAGVEYGISKQSNRAAFEVAPSGLSHSLLGLKGETEILPGWTGIFKLEAGFDPYSGQLANGQASLLQNQGVSLATQSSNGDSSRNGQAFNSQAYAGVSSPVWGTLTAGRQNSLLFDQGLAYDPAGGSYAFSWLGFSSTYVGGGATEDTRLDQSIKYRWAYGPVHVGALYQVGNYGNSGNSTWVHDVAQGNIGATYLGFSVDGTASKERGALNQTAASPTAAPGSGLGLTASDNTAYMATAKYRWDRFEVLGGYEWIGLANPSNPIIGLTSDSYGNPVASVTNTAYPNTRVLQFAWIGGKYQATDNLTVIASYYHVGQNSYGNGVGKTLSTSDGSAGCATNWAATCSGSIDATSLLFDYVFTKHFDTYAGVMYSKINGGLGQGYLNSWNVAPTVGARYIF